LAVLSSDSILSDEGEIEIWRGIAEDLAENGREFGAASLLAWLQDTASHAIQIGARKTIELSNVEPTLEGLYHKHVAKSHHTDRLELGEHVTDWGSQEYAALGRPSPD
jgi:hypothetical protein